MTVAQQFETWQTAGQQQFTNLAAFEREHPILVRGAVIVAVAATAGTIAGMMVAKGMLATKGAVAVPVAINAAATTPVATTLTNGAAAIGQAATMAKGAVTTGVATLQSANTLLSSLTTGGAAISGQLTTLLQTISTNVVPLTAGAVGGGAVSASVMQRQVNAVKERLQEQVAKATAFEAAVTRLQQTLNESVTTKEVAPAEQPATPLAQDPLEEIRGIGPVFARQLRAAGISTFANLATQTPEQLRAIMASVRANRMFNPQAWIDEARQRAGQAVPPAS